MAIRRKIIERKKEVKLRKNFLPTFLITLFLWLACISIIYFTDPSQQGALPLFFMVAFFSLFFTFSIIFINSRRGLISSAGITIFAVLRYFGLGNILNFLLLMGVCLSAEIYLSRNKS